MLRQRLRLQRAESVRTHRHWWWHVEVEPCTTSLPSPGDRQDVSVGFRTAVGMIDHIQPTAVRLTPGSHNYSDLVDARG
jgi:hypothetical protein